MVEKTGRIPQAWTPSESPSSFDLRVERPGTLNITLPWVSISSSCLGFPESVSVREGVSGGEPRMGIYSTWNLHGSMYTFLGLWLPRSRRKNFLGESVRVPQPAILGTLPGLPHTIPLRFTTHRSPTGLGTVVDSPWQGPDTVQPLHQSWHLGYHTRSHGWFFGHHGQRRVVGVEVFCRVESVRRC